MPSAKRTKIREDVLQELYSFHLVEKGRKAMIPKTWEEMNPEKFFALEYLAENRLIRFQSEGTHYMAKITAQGIAALKKKKQAATISAAVS
ncbi:MAG: hypothetical protein K0R57_2321 [Paenibacillaceae bacterium]|jgi:hypothetical protein|nr:hypothetical protein [Paenibacillaceae bacterium]